MKSDQAIVSYLTKKERARAEGLYDRFAMYWLPMTKREWVANFRLEGCVERELLVYEAIEDAWNAILTSHQLQKTSTDAAMWGTMLVLASTGGGVMPSGTKWNQRQWDEACKAMADQLAKRKPQLLMLNR